MTKRNTAGSGGKTERAIFLIAGCIMGALGALMAWFSYQWTVSNIDFDNRWIWIIGASGLAFFLLRGAYFTVIPQKKARKFDLESTR